MKTKWIVIRERGGIGGEQQVYAYFDARSEAESFAEWKRESLSSYKWLVRAAAYAARHNLKMVD